MPASCCWLNMSTPCRVLATTPCSSVSRLCSSSCWAHAATLALPFPAPSKGLTKGNRDSDGKGRTGHTSHDITCEDVLYVVSTCVCNQMTHNAQPGNGVCSLECGISFLGSTLSEVHQSLVVCNDAPISPASLRSRGRKCWGRGATRPESSLTTSSHFSCSAW